MANPFSLLVILFFIFAAPEAAYANHSDTYLGTLISINEPSRPRHPEESQMNLLTGSISYARGQMEESGTWQAGQSDIELGVTKYVSIHSNELFSGAVDPGDLNRNLVFIMDFVNPTQEVYVQRSANGQLKAIPYRQGTTPGPLPEHVTVGQVVPKSSDGPIAYHFPGDLFRAVTE